MSTATLTIAGIAALTSPSSQAENQSCSAPTDAARTGGTTTPRKSIADPEQSTISHAPTAGRHSPPTATSIANTAATPATSPTGSREATVMSDEQFEREKLYQASMEMFRMMLENGLITEDEYMVIDTRMKEKYTPIIGTLLSP
jgi:hypothetical protein